MLRRLGLALALLVAFASPAAAAIAFVQSDQFSAAGGGTTAALAFTSNNAAGNFIAVAVSWLGTDVVPTCADSANGAYTEAGTHLFDAGSGEGLGVFYRHNIAAGANTVTCQLTDSQSFRTLLIHEYSGVATSAALDDTTGLNSAGSGTTATTAALTCSVNGCLLFGALANHTSGTIAAGTDFTEREEDTGNWRASEDFTQTTAASHAATWTVGNNDDYTARLALFKPVAVGGSPAPTRGLMGVGR